MTSNKTMARTSGLGSEINSSQAAVGAPAPVVPKDHFTIAGTNAANTINGSAFNEWIYGYGGDDKLYGNGGKDRLFGGAGNDVLAGGSGSDEFVFATGGGNDLILDFQDGVDIINLADIQGISSFADLMDNIVQTFDGVEINLGNGDAVTLKGADMAVLSAGDFLF
jgi:Ca2+-binding RTX toxin-like protein